MSIVKVINSALALIGDELIVDEREETENALYARALAWDAVDYVLSKHQWTDATFRRRLTPDAKAPVHTYTKRFLLPSDPRCLTVWKVENTTDYLREGNYLIANEDYLNIVFTGAIRDLTFVGPELIECFGAYLALKLAPRLDLSGVKLQLLQQNYDNVLSQARHIDSANNSNMNQYNIVNVWAGGGYNG